MEWKRDFLFLDFQKISYFSKFNEFLNQIFLGLKSL